MPRSRIRFEDVRKSFRVRSRAATLRDALPAALGRLAGRRSAPAGRYGALNGVSFDLREGEVLGIIGVNGAGKSTSLRLAARIMLPDSGAVRVDGRVAAMIELYAGFHPDLSGRENILLSGALLGLRLREIRPLVDQVVAFAAIGTFIDAPLRTYSSGMQMRLGFAVASTVPAETMLVDEVLAVGDLEFQSRCLQRMQERRAAGAAILFVSHNLLVVEQFCDRVLLLDHGQVVAEGKPSEVVDEHRRRVLAPQPGEPGAGTVHGRRGTGAVLLAAVSNFWETEAGGPLDLAFDWETRTEIRGPLFGVIFHGADGTILGEIRSGDRGDPSVVLRGRGKVRVRVPALPLLPGAYRMSAFVRDASGLVDFDFQPQALVLSVRGERGPAESGAVRFAPSWRLEAS